MLNIKLLITVLTFSCLLMSCGKKKEIVTEQTKEKTKKADLYPRYDSIDWFTAFTSNKLDPADLEYKKTLIEGFFQEHWLNENINGGFLVAQHGNVIFERYQGYANTVLKDTINARTPIHIASISKVLTSLAILKLVEHHKISLDQKIHSILKDFPYDDISIQDLLNHRSGIPNYFYVTENPKVWSQDKVLDNKDVLKLITDKILLPDSKADTKFAYSNTNYVLLALIIEEVTHKKYAEAMDYMVFKPLGMKDTYVFDLEKDSITASLSYYYNGNKWDFNYLDKTYGDKNIYSTPHDLLQMDIAMYSKDFLPQKLMEKMTSGYSYEAKGVNNYGLGIRMKEYDNGEKLLYHNGWWHGNQSTYVRDYKNHVTIIALGNRQNRSIYKSFNLASIFGDYPLEVQSNKKNIQSQDNSEEFTSKSDTIRSNHKKLIVMDSIKQS